MTKKTESTTIVYPFSSDKFMETWDMWIKYKKEVHNFNYKGVWSLQMTLVKLTELSAGDEDKAIRIIQQSIMQQWAGLFPLHIPSIKENGSTKSTKKSSPKDSGESGTLRERVQAAVNKRYGNGEQQGGTDNPS